MLRWRPRASSGPRQRPGAMRGCALHAALAMWGMLPVAVRAAMHGTSNQTAIASPGCVLIDSFHVNNQCDKALLLKGWNQIIPPGEHVVQGSRQDDALRLSWRLVDGPSNYDYVELSGSWLGPGSELCGHPNYATWLGFTPSSRYEALDPASGAPACADA